MASCDTKYIATWDTDERKVDGHFRVQICEVRVHWSVGSISEIQYFDARGHMNAYICSTANLGDTPADAFRKYVHNETIPAALIPRLISKVVRLQDGNKGCSE